MNEPKRDWPSVLVRTKRTGYGSQRWRVHRRRRAWRPTVDRAAIHALLGRLMIGLMLLASTWVALPASAQEFRGTLDVIGAASQEPMGADQVTNVPLFGILSFDANQLNIPSMHDSRVVFQGWGRIQVGDDEYRDSSGDINLLFLESGVGPVWLKLGRQQLPRGLARMDTVDGLNALVRLPVQLSLQGYFGMETRPEFAWDGGSWRTGGRLAWSPLYPAEIAFSYSYLRSNGVLGRQELGLDGYGRFGPVRLLGLLAYMPNDRRISEGRLAVDYTPTNGLTIGLNGEIVSPGLLINRSSIFSVFSHDNHNAFGGQLVWDRSDYYDVTVSGHFLSIDSDVLGYRTFLRVLVYREPNHRSLVGGEMRRVDESENAYLQWRLWTALQVIQQLRLSADGFIYSFDERVNGARNTYLGQVSAIWDIAQSMQLTGTFQAGQTPYSRYEIAGLIRFTYGIGVDLGQEVGP